MRTLRPSEHEPRRLRIEWMGEHGEGVGRVEDHDVHVPGAFVGEEVMVVVEAVSRHHLRAHARLVQVLAAHPERRESPCPRDVARGGRCTGCPLLGLGIEAQRRAHLVTLARLHGLEASGVARGRELGYRWSSKRIAFDTRDGIAFGSFRRGSHRPAEMAGCLVEHPRIEAALHELREEARARRVRAAGEGPVIEGAWLKTDGERVLLTLVGAAPPHRALFELARALEASDGVHYSERTRGSDALRGAPPVRLAGAGSLSLEVAGVAVELGPLGFLQPNPEVAAAAYRALVGSGRAVELAFDLYAGAGVTTALLRARAHEVAACEAYPESAAALGVAPRTAEAFLREALARGARPELVVANPPRGGMGAEVTALLRELAPAELRIMSCSAKTLARDLEALAPDYERVSVEAFDTLPQTGHLELVAALRRRDG